MKEYQQRIFDLESKISEQSKLHKRLQESFKEDHDKATLQTKYENENKLKIMKENKGTF